MPDTTAYNLSRTGTISSLFFKNLWVLFSAIFVVSLIGTLFTTYLFMKSTAVESTRFLADDLTSQLNTVYSLLEGMSEQPLIKDTSIPVQERAASMKTYADAFGFWMIGVVDPDGTISSTLRPKTGKVQRGYIPRIMASGKREISDPFPAGATGDMTYSQFMPIKKRLLPDAQQHRFPHRASQSRNEPYAHQGSRRGRTVPLRQQPGNLPPRHQKRSAGDVHQHF